MVANSESNKSRACILVCYGCKQRVQQVKSLYSGLLWLQTASPTSQEPYSGLLWLQTASPTTQEPYSGLLWFQTASPTTQENNGLLVVAVGESIDDGVWCIQRQFLESVVWMRWREFLRPTNRVLRHIHSITPLSPLPFFYGWLCLMSSDTPLIDAGGGGGCLCTDIKCRFVFLRSSHLLNNLFLSACAIITRELSERLIYIYIYIIIIIIIIMHGLDIQH